MSKLHSEVEEKAEGAVAKLPNCRFRIAFGGEEWARRRRRRGTQEAARAAAETGEWLRVPARPEATFPFRGASQALPPSAESLLGELAVLASSCFLAVSVTGKDAVAPQVTGGKGDVWKRGPLF